jgi:uncharacterized protein with HEPN domain
MKTTKMLLLDMLNAIESIEYYAVSSYEAFLGDEKSQDANLYPVRTMLGMS